MASEPTYSPPLPDQRADLIGMLRAEQVKRDAISTDEWLTAQEWIAVPEPMYVGKDCQR